MTSKTKLPKGLTFEKALERLEKIVADLEEPERGLEASLELFEEGVALSRFCRGKLEEIQKRVDVVLKETPDGLVTEPLDADEEPGGGDEGEEEKE